MLIAGRRSAYLLPTVRAFEGRLACPRKRQVVEAWVEPKVIRSFCSQSTPRHPQRVDTKEQHQRVYNFLVPNVLREILKVLFGLKNAHSLRMVTP